MDNQTHNTQLSSALAEVGRLRKHLHTIDSRATSAIEQAETDASQLRCQVRRKASQNQFRGMHLINNLPGDDTDP